MAAVHQHCCVARHAAAPSRPCSRKGTGHAAAPPRAACFWPACPLCRAGARGAGPVRRPVPPRRLGGLPIGRGRRPAAGSAVADSAWSATCWTAVRADGTVGDHRLGSVVRWDVIRIGEHVVGVRVVPAILPGVVPGSRPRRAAESAEAHPSRTPRSVTITLSIVTVVTKGYHQPSARLSHTGLAAGARDRGAHLPESRSTSPTTRGAPGTGEPG